MKAIHKYSLDLSGEAVVLSLKEGFRVVRCEYVVPEKRVCLWVETSLKVDAPFEEAAFRVVYSGEPIAEHHEYLDTALDPFSPEAYHVFRLHADEKSGRGGSETNSLYRVA